MPTPAKAVGLYLLAWAIFTAYMTIAALRVNGAVLAVFVLLTVTFLLLAIGEFATSDPIHQIGGYVGLATALAAWYASFAGVTAFTYKQVARARRPALTRPTRVGPTGVQPFGGILGANHPAEN